MVDTPGLTLDGVIGFDDPDFPTSEQLGAAAADAWQLEGPPPAWGGRPPAAEADVVATAFAWLDGGTEASTRRGRPGG